MSKKRNVDFQIHPSNDGQYYCKTVVGESTYVGETVKEKRSALKTARSTIKKIQSGLVAINEFNKEGVAIKNHALTLLFILCSTFASAQFAPVTPGGLKSSYYQDLDADGYGNSNVMKYQKRNPIGYVLAKGDCDDNNAKVYPGVIEAWNNIDDDCDGIADDGLVADLTITNTGSLAEPRLATMPTVDIFFQNGYQVRNVTDPVYVGVLKAAGIKYLQSTTGAYAQYVRVYPQKTMLGGGMGYNIPAIYGDALQGVGKQQFYIDGKPYDFACAGDSLRKLIGAGGIIEANIATAPIEDLYVQIDRLVASGQKQIIIQQGNELVINKSFIADGFIYAKEFDARVIKTEAKYPEIDFLWSIDAEALWKAKTSIWNSQVATVKKKQMRDDYLHLMYLLNEGFTDDLAHNLSEMEYAYKIGLPSQLNIKIGNPGFDTLGINISQWSAAIDAYTPKVQKGMFLTAMFNLQFLKTVNEWNAVNNNRVKSACFMSLKGSIDSKNNVTLDWQLLSKCYKLFQPNAYTCTAEHRWTDVDVAATVAYGTYHIIIQNHSGIDLSLPVNVDLDGRHTTFAPTTSEGLSVDSFYDTQADNYDASTLRKFSLNYYKQ